MLNAAIDHCLDQLEVLHRRLDALMRDIDERLARLDAEIERVEHREPAEYLNQEDRRGF